MDQPSHPFTDTLNGRFGGLLRSGSHEPDGMACALEAVNIARGNEWSDNPQTARMPDLRGLNDAKWPSDKARTKAMVPVVLALWDWDDWGTMRQVAWAKRVAERTIREIVPPALRAIGLNAEADRCEQEGTQEAAWSAASAASAAAAESAWSAWSAESAESASAASAAAAESAWSAWSAESAAWSAESAESAAESAESAESALELICRIFVETASETAPVVAA